MRMTSSCGLRTFIPNNVAAMPLPMNIASAASGPKKCSGLLMYLSRKRMVIRSKNHAEGAAQAVMAFAALAIHVADGNFADRCAVPAGQRGNKAVHFAVEGNILDDLAAIGLESGAEVVDGHAGKPRHEPVGACGRNAAQDEVVDARLAPAGDDVVALVELFKKCREYRWDRAAGRHPWPE